LLKYVLQLPPHQDLYEPFFKYYKFQGQSENAINLYEQIENENFSFNPIVYIEMVKHYLKHYQTSRAIAVLSAWYRFSFFFSSLLFPNFFFLKYF